MTPTRDATCDRTCQLATRLLGAPTSLVTLVEPGRQVYKGAAGVPETFDAARETWLDDSPCQHVAATGRPLVVDSGRPSDRAHPGQAYLGVPLRSAGGEVLGALCAIDALPRTWTDDDLATLVELAEVLADSMAYREAQTRLADESRARADAQALTAAAISALDDLVVVVDLDGRLQQWNDALTAVAGEPAGGLAGLTLDALFVPGDAGRVRAAVRDARAGGPASLTAAIQAPGGPVPHELVCACVHDSAGATVGVCVTGRDLTARLASEAALRQSEARHRGLIEALPDLFLRLSRDGRYLDVKASDPTLLVHEPRQLVGWTVEASLPPAPASTLLAAVGRALDADALQCIEYELRRGDGQLRHYEARIVPVGEDEVQAVVRDVTDRVEARQAIHESELRFRSFVEATTQVVWMADAAGNVSELSAAWADFTGQTAQEIAGWGWVDAVHPDDLPGVIEAWQASIAARSTHEIEYRVRSASGPYHRFAIRAIPISDHDSFLGWVGTCTDVEDARQAAEAAEAHEAALVAAMAVAERGRAEAEEAARMKSAMLANLSHEIRTPLTSIIGFADMLAEGAALREPDGDEGTFATLIGRGGRRLLHTLTSVLDLAQMEAGRHEVVLRPLDVCTVVTDTAALLRTQAEDKGLAFRVDLPDRPVVMPSDEGALGRVLTNLIGNAVKFTETGSVAIALRSDDDGVEISVADTGRGISATFLPLLFDEFRQESEGHGRRYEGNGLGLAITKRLVEMLGGTIAVTSEIGAGSAFAVRLPAV
ncbi:PAS domain-containing protein [Rubrivirga sp. IMCC43871]|uniref:sensor histidine kinase n=1 Tax=Rubrivirga sp. IMCC43871 TaxID=3391575 RepID=UPI0039902130